MAETGESGAVALKTASVPGVGGDIGEYGVIGGSMWLTRVLESRGLKYSSGSRVLSWRAKGGFGEGRGVTNSVSSSATFTLLNRNDSSSR